MRGGDDGRAGSRRRRQRLVVCSLVARLHSLWVAVESHRCRERGDLRSTVGRRNCRIVVEAGRVLVARRIEVEAVAVAVG